MTFGLVIECNNRNIFSSKIMQKMRHGDLVPDLFLFSKKALHEIKASGLTLSFNISITLNLAYNTTKLYKTVEYWSWDILNFDIFKRSGNSFSNTFCVWIFEKNVSHVIFYLTDQFQCDCLLEMLVNIDVLQLFISQVVTP